MNNHHWLSRLGQTLLMLGIVGNRKLKSSRIEDVKKPKSSKLKLLKIDVFNEFEDSEKMKTSSPFKQ